MTLLEMSGEYWAEAEALRVRIAELRRETKSCPESRKFRLERRIAELTAIQRETRELAALLEHYYERGYCRNGKYTL
ncbi:MAG: hypothetical protein PUC06_05560 [Oscillospiraceae bacterium]|nr:hypothetical protein [Oscillospiraceae bacterium]